MTYLVTGATGTVGGAVVEHLLAGGYPVRALTRNPSAAKLPAEVEVVEGSLQDEDSLKRAFDGVTAAHLVSFGDNEGPLENGERIVELLGETGVQRCTVLVNWIPGDLQPALTEAGFPWTHLLPVEFMSNKITVDQWDKAIRTDGIIREATDSAGPLVHPSDIGAVAAAALTTAGHTGEEYLITGPASVAKSEQVATIGEVLGRELEFVVLPPDEAAEHWRHAGLPEHLVQIKLQLADPANISADIPDEAYRPSSTVQDVTGRPALSFRQWVHDNIDAFR